MMRVCGSAVLAVLILANYSSMAAQGPAGMDWARLHADSIQWLADLIRIDTTNPPGNELAAAKYIAQVLEREGISAEVLESSKGRGIVIARLRAGAVPDPSRALLLLAHTDVVGVDRKKWTVDPFGGVVKDGFLYGRGALDMKGPLVAYMAAFVALKRAGTPLSRDVIFLAEADEEAGGDDGIEFAIRHHWEKIAAGHAINEGGHTLVKNGKVVYVGVQAAEKVPVNVNVIATGTAGHASIPRPDNAIVRLSNAVAKIAAYEPPAKLQTVTRRYFEQLAPLVDVETGKWMRALEQPDRFQRAVLRLTEASPQWGAMLRNTISPTILEGGVRSNVIPSEARATLNIRLLPGELIADLLAELRKVVNDPNVRLEADPASRQQSPPSPVDGELFQTIERVAPKFFPGAAVLPLMSTWATDSAQLRLRNVQAFGLIPFPLTEEELARMHSDDERIPLDAFRKGIEFTFRVVEEFVKTK
ncbi:MAG TPA: M20/M25/M40 family metallo-hydrolase [Candidatus Nitrosotenuis sp.]|nr:M20/M25/M40 family metallo-hydrolase [Candidatus Nitrosotenuis sp.]